MSDPLQIIAFDKWLDEMEAHMDEGGHISQNNMREVIVAYRAERERADREAQNASHYKGRYGAELERADAWKSQAESWEQRWGNEHAALDKMQIERDEAHVQAAVMRAALEKRVLFSTDPDHPGEYYCDLCGSIGQRRDQVHASTCVLAADAGKKMLEEMCAKAEREGFINGALRISNHRPLSSYTHDGANTLNEIRAFCDSELAALAAMEG